MRRVKDRWKNSGIVQEVKSREFYEPPVSDNMQKRQAVQQMKKQKKQKYLEKTGKRQNKGFDKFGRRKGS
jgi:ribosomal protein S21